MVEYSYVNREILGLTPGLGQNFSVIDASYGIESYQVSFEKTTQSTTFTYESQQQEPKRDSLTLAEKIATGKGTI